MTAGQLAFVDETGNPNMELAKPGVSSFFIVVSVLVEGADLDRAREQVEKIRRRHFQIGEIKSQKVASHGGRRLRILGELSAVPFRFHGFVVDKRQIFPDGGLIYKQSFVKFLHRQVYQRLFSCFPDMQVTADEYGDKEFMAGFKKYVERLTEPTLFARSRFDFRDSRTEPLLQVADFIAGSLAAALEPEKGSVAMVDVMAAIGGNRALIETWPIQRRPAGLWDASTTPDSADRLVRDHCFNQAYLFIEEHHDSSDVARMHQVRTVRYLLDHSDADASRGYVVAERLIDHLKAFGSGPVSIVYFRSEVIAKLRDDGVVIASSAHGYKVPNSVADVRSFVRHVQTMVEPLLGRLRTARNQLLLASKGDLDIVKSEEFGRLRAMLDVAGGLE
jgi:Protein of unknown function (DUF3800)